MEKFIIINGLNHYAISNYGHIKNVKKDKLLTPVLNNNGYLQYTFRQDSLCKTIRIHRIVALYFVPNPDNKPYVNHIDGNKQNNHYSNLEWCTAQENDNHARKTGLKVQEKPVLATEILSGEEMTFKSVTEAGAILGINKGTITKVLNGRRNKTHGYTFRYL